MQLYRTCESQKYHNGPTKKSRSKEKCRGNCKNEFKCRANQLIIVFLSVMIFIEKIKILWVNTVILAGYLWEEHYKKNTRCELANAIKLVKSTYIFAKIIRFREWSLTDTVVKKWTNKLKLPSAHFGVTFHKKTPRILVIA